MKKLFFIFAIVLALAAAGCSSGQSNHTITAGNKTGYFGTYHITIPTGWTSTENSNTLSIKKDTYTLVISQTAGGGANCFFPGDSTDTEGPMGASFSSFTAIKGKFLEYGRGHSGDTDYLVCEKNGKNYHLPSEFGYISYKGPANYDQSVLSEMDGMIGSLRKE